VNNSGILPVGVSILVLPEQVEETTESGIVIATPSELERFQLKQTDGVVVAVGPLAFFDEKDPRGNVIPRCRVGQRVVMTAYAGMIRKGKDGLMYRLIRDSDVIGIIEE
jgi:co-chaperonin GroES (HSP10)